MRRVLVTRPQAGASATAHRLAAKGYTPVILPLTEIVPLVPDAPPEGVDAIVATSANAFRHMPKGFLDGLQGVPLYVVGAKTAEAAGREVAHVAPDARELAAMLAGELGEAAHVLHLTGRVRRPELRAALEEAGHTVTEIELYDARAVQFSAAEIGTKLGLQPFWAALVYSQRGGELLAKIVADAPALFASTRFVCISIDAGQELQAIGAQMAFAELPDEAGLLARLDALAG